MVRLSPEITPTRYRRDGDDPDEEPEVQRYTYEKVMVPNVDNHPRVVITPDGVLRYFGEPFDAYFHSGHCHVSESIYRNHGMAMLREYVLDCLVQLSDDGLIVGLRKTDDKLMR